MTRVIFYESKVLGFDGFSLSGHSGYAEHGNDIICAAVSSATELVIAMIEDTFKFDCSLNINPESADVDLTFDLSEDNIAKKEIINNIIDAYYMYILELSKKYPKNICCKTSERNGL